MMLVNSFELSSDRFEGRLVGSPGNAAARALIVEYLRKTGVQPFGDNYEHVFSLPERRGANLKGVNVVGVVNGSSIPEKYIVVSAHYDHLGVRNGEIYNGMDDNASGTAAVMAMAQYFQSVYRPHHSIIFALLDGEEGGLMGARDFVANPPVELEDIILNVNLDMVSRSDKDELYASGTYYHPYLRDLLLASADSANERTGGAVALKLGHDTPGTGSDDWTNSSDHGPFHSAGVPHVYFGVEDHDGYHKPSDDFADTTPLFYVNAVEVILESVIRLDASFETLVAE